MSQFSVMGIEGWRDRLRAAVDADERSWRRISKDAGLNPGYLHSIFVGTKGAKQRPPQSAKLDSLEKLCATLCVSSMKIVYGFEVGRPDEAFFEFYATLPDDAKAFLVQAAQLQGYDPPSNE